MSECNDPYWQKTIDFRWRKTEEYEQPGVWSSAIGDRVLEQRQIRQTEIEPQSDPLLEERWVPVEVTQ